MKIDWTRSGAETFSTWVYLARGFADHGGRTLVAFAALPGDTPEAEIPARAAPLLRAKFAAGEWGVFSGPGSEAFQICVSGGALCDVGTMKPIRREPVEVTL